MPTTTHPGIRERRDRHGRIRYLVRVRRNGATMTATLPTLAEALSWRSRALDAADGRGDMPEAPRRLSADPAPPGRALTLTDAARRFVRGMRDASSRTRDGRAYGRATTANYEGALRRLVLPELGAVPVATITRGDVQRLVNEVAGRVSVEHARTVRAAVAAVMHQCEDYGELDSTPCVAIRVGHAHDDHPDTTPARVLSPAEGAALLDAADRDDETHGRSLFGPFVRLALTTGLRRGEILALSWGQDGLDLDAGTVHVHRALATHRDEAGRYPFLPPKSRKSLRDVPIPAAELPALRRHRLATRRPADGELVLADERGNPLGWGGRLRLAWDRSTRTALGTCSLCATRHVEWTDDDDCAHVLAALPTPHDLRHTYASDMLRTGRTARAVADLLGHADASLVLRRYAHVLPDELSDAAERLAEWRAQNR
jgi:integrase